MSVASANDGLFTFDPALRGSLIVSAVFHVAVVAVLGLSMPYISKDNLLLSNPVSVEIIDVSDIAQTNNPAPPKKKAPEKPPEEKPKPAPKVTAEKPPELAKPTPPDVKKDVAKPRDAVPPPKPLEKKKVEKPKPKPKKPPKKKEAPPKTDDFASLLKNLTPDVVEETTSAEVSQIASLADRLTISEMDAVKRGLMPCWNIQIGAKNAEDLVVEIRVLMNPDRSVLKATIMNQSRYNRDSHFRAAAEAALRALRNPRCAPLQLPPDKYEQWKTTIIEFNPGNML